MHREIHAVKADAVFIAAVQLMESLETIRPGGWDIDYWVEHQDVLTFECQRRNTAPWWPGMQAKYLAGLAPNGPRWMTASYFYPWWRLYAAPEAENRPWIAQQFANGVSTWLHINGGYSQLFDRRGLAPMRAVFARLAKWEPYFDGASSAAEVAIVFSRHTQDIYGGAKPHARYLDCVRGYYCALQEAHIPFDVLSDKRLDEATLARYRVIVLPNTAVMSADVAAALQRYVEKGGGLVATFETAACGLDGAVRPESALAATLGVERVGYRDNLQSSYSRIENPADPLCRGLGDTDLIANDGALVEVRPHARTRNAADADTARDRARRGDDQHPGIQRDFRCFERDSGGGARRAAVAAVRCTLPTGWMRFSIATAFAISAWCSRTQCATRSAARPHSKSTRRTMST